MVAEVSASQPKPPKKPFFHPGNRIPEAIRLQVRSLYVIQGFTPSQIGPMVSLEVQQVRNLVSRERWTTQRAKSARRKETNAIALQDARADADVKRVVEAQAILSEELSLRSLNLSSEFLDAKDAKSLQMASGAAMNFVKIARMSRGLDQRSGASGNQDNAPTLNLFVVRGETLERVVKQADAAVVDVSAKQIP